jgi:hypothetical protein
MKSSPRLQIVTEGGEESDKVSKVQTKNITKKKSLSLPLPETMISPEDSPMPDGTGDIEPGEDEEITPSFTIDSELVLREVVDRKCRLQALTEKVNIERLTKVLVPIPLF